MKTVRLAVLLDLATLNVLIKYYIVFFQNKAQCGDISGFSICISVMKQSALHHVINILR